VSSLRNHLAARRAALTPTEQRVADQIVANMSETLTMSAMQIAHCVGVSDATVVRSVRALGFEGLPALRVALAEELQRQATPAARLDRTLSDFSEADTSDVRACLDLVRSAVEEIGNRVTDSELYRARDMVATAARNVLVGYGLSLDLCRYLAAQMRRIGLDAEAIGASGPAFADDLCRLRATDVIILFAYTSVSREAEILLRETSERRLPVILVTDRLGDLLADRVTLTLNAGRGKAGMYSVHAGTLTLFEGLLLAVAYQDRDRAQARLQELQRLRRDLRHE